MRLQNCIKLIALVPVGLMLAACADNSKKYRDTSDLERPPHLDIVVTKTEREAETSSDSATDPKSDSKSKVIKGLGDLVTMTDESQLVFKLSPDEAMRWVAIALKSNGIDINDRNREKGQIYILFDPDFADTKNGEKPSLLSSFLAEDHYPSARYLLTLTESTQGTTLKAEFLEYKDNQMTKEDAPDNGVAKLVKKLYLALHDDTPIN